MLRLEGEKGLIRKAQELIDALPYVDGLNPQSRQQVDVLIEEEARRGIKRPQDYLKEMGPGPSLQFEEHPLLAAEYERCETPGSGNRCNVKACAIGHFAWGQASYACAFGLPCHSQSQSEAADEAPGHQPIPSGHACCQQAE